MKRGKERTGKVSRLTTTARVVGEFQRERTAAGRPRRHDGDLYLACWRGFEVVMAIRRRALVFSFILRWLVAGGHQVAATERIRSSVRQGGRRIE